MPFEEADYKVTIKPSARIEDVSLAEKVVDDYPDAKYLDLCVECTRDLDSFLQKQSVPEKRKPYIPPKSEDLPKQEEEKKKPGPKRKIDYGKIEALANAGWRNVQIAEEMNLSSGQVSMILKRIRKDKKEKEHENM